MWLQMANGTAAMWMISSTVTDTLTAIVPFAGTATKWTSISSRGCWQNAPTLSILFLPHQIFLSRSVWSCEDSMTGRSRCRHQSCIVSLRWQMPRRYLSAATSLKNRWQVLCLVPILIVCFAFLCSASRIWKLSFPARRAFISGWTISAMWLSFSMHFSKTRSSNPAGSLFSTKDGSCNLRTADGLLPHPIFHPHFPPSERTWHRSPTELKESSRNWKYKARISRKRRKHYVWSIRT